MNLLELINRYTTLHKVASTHGGEYAGACPFCGGWDRFRVWPHTDQAHYWCRKCNRRGDSIQFLRDREGLTFREACERLGQPLSDAPRLHPTPKPPPLAEPPREAWQIRARTFVEVCEHILWTPAGAEALAYLHRRGLTDETIRVARLGYHAVEQWDSAERWALPADHKKLYLVQGIVFPWYVGSEVWRVTFRRDGEAIPKAERYKAVAGGSNTLYRVDTLRPNTPAMLVEGTFDALNIAQEAGDLIAVLAASTSWGRLERWIGRLALACIVLLGFDADQAGEQAAAWWRKALGVKAKRWRPYWDDPNAMLQGGVDLRTWIREGLGQEPRWWRDMARWPEDRREEWGERSSMMEIDGGLSRDAAEQEAYALLAERPK